MSGRRARGVTLIEVLVSLVVVSVGVLSAVSLQLVAKQNNFEASQRLEATHLAYGLMERMRANSSPEALQTYDRVASPSLGGGQIDDMPSPNCSGPGAECSPVDLAEFDLWLWEQLLDGVTEQVATGGGVYFTGGLMFPTACVEPPADGAGTDGTYVVTVAFRGSMPMTPDPGVACGAGASRDGFRLYGENDEFRRSVAIRAFIQPAVPK